LLVTEFQVRQLPEGISYCLNLLKLSDDRRGPSIRRGKTNFALPLERSTGKFWNVEDGGGCSFSLFVRRF
jgi:hypothetical protein